MKTKLMAVLLASAMLLSLAPIALASDGGGDVTVTYWTHQRHDMEYIGQIVEEFNALDNGIKVEMQIYTDNFGDLLAAAYQTGQAPDIFTNFPTGMNLVDGVRAGMVMPIEDLISDELREKNSQFFVETINMVDGKLYTLPFVGYNFRLAVNLDACEGAGVDPDAIKTYDDLVAAAKKITEWGATQEPRVYGFMLPTGEWNWIWDGQYYGALARYNGEFYYDFKTGKADFESIRPIMEMYLKMKEDGSLFPGGVEMINDPARQQFSEGTVGMMVAASWDIGVFNDQFPAKINWKCVNLPTYDGELHGKGNLSGGDYLKINAAAKNPEACMEWLSYLLSDEVLEGYYSGAYGLPLRAEISSNAKVQPEKKGFSDFANTEIDAIYPPLFPYSAPEPNYGNYLNQVMMGSITIDQAIETLNMLYNAAIEEEISSGGDPTPYIYPNFDFMDPAGSSAK
ncbi:MAG: extracellular solute-binding protein [Oscillospiraceae bacterium]|jgi:multiple sugar transport system substrate-binding protein|nr:extracellular solute-binding protein [Oscillospiraceae bacterium]